MMDVIGGVDLGGTGSRFVIQGPHGVIASATVATAELGAGNAGARLDRLAETVRGLLPHDTRLMAVGIGATGPVDRNTGIVHNRDTLPWFSYLPLTAGLRERLGIPVFIDNDAVAAAVAEFGTGAGNGASRMLMVTLGTGIGAAFLVDGEPFRGPNGSHPEAGHIPISQGMGRCYCGAIGCWELLASRSALQAMLRPHLDGVVADSEIIPRAAALALESEEIRNAFERYGRNVGRGLSILHTLYIPRVTVLGGSAAHYLPLFVEEMHQELGRSKGFEVASDIRIATLGDSGGAIGAVLIARDLLS
jgi:glucokinase